MKTKLNQHRILWMIAVIAVSGVVLLVLSQKNQENKDMPQSNYVESELSRIRSLLGTNRTDSTLVEIDPEPSPDSIGAEAGLGFKSTDNDIQFSVYVFKDWDGSTTAAEEFEARHADDPNIYAPIATNGPLVFYGYVNTDAPNGVVLKYALADFVEAFAGDE